MNETHLLKYYLITTSHSLAGNLKNLSAAGACICSSSALMCQPGMALLNIVTEALKPGRIVLHWRWSTGII